MSTTSQPDVMHKLFGAAFVLAAGVLGPVAIAPQTAALESAPAATWNAVLVSGDDSLAVWDNGIEAIGEQLRDRGVTEVAELRASDGTATIGEIGRAIAAMRPGDGGGCLIYLTSHGSPDGLLLTNEADAGSPPMLTPDELAAMLDIGCDTAPTALVVSACYSGTFITPAMTAGANRVVVTAARADRTSFGCSADHEYTFFDRCVIDSLPAATTWPALYDDVVECVGAKEAELGVTPSEPQLHEGTAAGDLTLPTAGTDPTPPSVPKPPTPPPVPR